MALRERRRRDHDGEMRWEKKKGKRKAENEKEKGARGNETADQNDPYAPGTDAVLEIMARIVRLRSPTHCNWRGD